MPMTEDEYALLVQADAHVATMLPRADDYSEYGLYPLWHGWALREAWLAGYAAAKSITPPAEALVIAQRKGCCTVALSGADHFPRVGTWYVEWLPKGYGPGPDDILICAFPDQGWAEQGYGLGRGNRPPIIEAVCAAVDKFMREQQP